MRLATAANTTRMNLTILSWDIAGSCALLQALGLERYSEVVRASQEEAAQTIEAHGGYVARYMGDALLAYFGFPEGRPDDAERAVQAGRALPLIWSDRGAVVRARVAIATGQVLVGAALGAGSAREFPAFGEPPNVASRLLGAAPEGGIVMDEATRAAAGPGFGLLPIEGLSLKGLPHVRRAWLVSPLPLGRARPPGDRHMLGIA